MASTDGYYSLFADVNKLHKNEDNEEGVISLRTPELDLKVEDEELLKLKKQWETRWSVYVGRIEEAQKENEKYWKGKHFTEVEMEKRPLIDNRIFSSLETFLPIITKQNPEPQVTGDNSEQGEALADKVRKMLSYQADIQKLKLKLKKMTRMWALYMLGCVKVGWDRIEDDIKTVVVRTQKLVLDPDATIDEDGYTGEYIGEYRRDKASLLVVRFPSKKAIIEKEVDKKMGTEVQYMEWWTNDYMFWTLKNEVLGKARNPHWNYDKDIESTDQYGQIMSQSVTGKNHFTVPQKPYVFLSVFNVGLHPYDDTSMIQQNLALQDLINKRMRQIDRNVDGMNGGVVISGDVFSAEQASQITDALRKGAAILVPGGDVNTAYKRETGTPLPGDVFNNLLDARNEVDNIFGTHAATRGERQGPETATGKLLLKGGDESRAGMITDYIEQVADKVFNWWVQLMYVYYDEAHVASILGEEKTKEYITLQKDEFQGKLLISVREGSLVPKDPLIKREEALQLWSAGAIGPIELYEKLDFPNPRKSAEQLFMWQTNPASLFPNLAPPMPVDPGMPPPVGNIV